MLAWVSGQVNRTPFSVANVRAWAEWVILCVLIVAVVFGAIHYLREKAAIAHYRYESARLQAKYDELLRVNRKLIIQEKKLCGISDLERIAKRLGLREPTDTPMFRIRTR